MSKLTRAGAITVAIFSSIGVAAGQNAPSPTNGTARADLTPKQEQMVSQGLATSPSQLAPAGAPLFLLDAPEELATAVGALRPVARETTSLILAQEVERALRELVDRGPEAIARARRH